MNCSAPLPGPRGSRNWWDESPARPPESNFVLWWVLAVVVVLVAVMWLGGVR